MKGSCLSATQVVPSATMMFLCGYLLIQKGPKDVLRLNSSLETLLCSTFPPIPMPTPETCSGTTNTDVLFSILLHCFSAHPYFTFLIVSAEDAWIWSCFPGFGKQGQSRTGQREEWLPAYPSTTWKHTSQSFSCFQKSACDSLSSDFVCLFFLKEHIISEDYINHFNTSTHALYLRTYYDYL